MNITRLQYFLTLAVTGSVTEAARKQFISPTALSRAIKLLEAEVGHQVIEPDGRGITLTDQGRKLAILAEPLVHEINALPFSLNRELSHLHQQIRIASHEVFATYLLTPMLDALDSRKLHLRYAIPGDIEDMVARGQSDVGLTMFPKEHAEVEHTPIATVQMGVYGHSDYLAKPSSGYVYAVPVRPVAGSPTRTFGIDGWPDDTVERTVGFEVTHTESALELCRSQRAVAVFPDFVVSLHNNQVRKPFQLQLKKIKGVSPHDARAYLVTRKGSDHLELETALQEMFGHL